MPVQFGNYQILRKIGAGGMAQVFEAQRVGAEGFSRRVALKCILPEMTRDHRFVEMFVNEARLGSQLHHPNIVEIQDFNKINDVYYIAMEFVEGIDLGEVIARFRDEEREFPPGLAIDIILQALEGLGYAHEATTDDGELMNIIHRDIKPSNLLLTRRGTVKIADFGIAKAATNAYQTRTAELTKGSLAYMAPEQITREAPVSAASDLFAIGAVLFEILSLRALFDGENMPSIMFKVAQVEIERDMSEFGEHYPQLVPILRRALARDLSQRYRTAAEMSADLRSIRDQFPRTPTIAEIVAEFARPHPIEDDDGMGDQTVSLLGFTPQTPLGAPPPVPGLAVPSGGPGALGPLYDPQMGQSTVYLPINAVPGVATPEGSEDSQPSISVGPGTTGKPSRAALVMGAAALVLLVGGLLWMFGVFNRSASITVTSMPLGAQIFVNGQPRVQALNGRPIPVVTPYRLQLEGEGVAIIGLEMAGFERHEEQVVYRPGDMLEIAPTLKQETGSLDIVSTPPGATIQIDGRTLEQKTPARIDGLREGNYQIQLSLAGYVATSGRVEVRRKSATAFSGTLVEEVVAPTPTPGSSPTVTAPGRGSTSPVAVRTSERTPVRSEATAPTPTETPRQAVPGAASGKVVINAVPPNCTVLVDGKEKGDPPVTTQLSPGSHSVTLKWKDGTAPTSFKVQAVSGEVKRYVWIVDIGDVISE